MTVNNCLRLLNSHKTTFQLYTLSNTKRSALEVAEILNIDSFLVHKTIVLTRLSKKKPILAVIPGPLEVDLKKVALLTGEKKIHFPTQNEAETLTGMQSGGISPLGLFNKGFQVILDELSTTQPDLIISGGQRGLFVKLAVVDFIDLTSAMIASIT